MNNIGAGYDTGYGVEMDKKKPEHYYQLAAMKGNVQARNSLGCMEQRVGNIDRAIKHYMIAVGDGYNKSLKNIQRLYLNGLTTKDDYTKALRLYREYLGQIKSVQRDEAAAFHESYKYIE